MQESVQASAKENKSKLFKVFVQLFQQYLTLQVLSTSGAGEDEVDERVITAVQSLAVFCMSLVTNHQLPSMIATTFCHTLNFIIPQLKKIWNLRMTILDGRPMKGTFYTHNHSFAYCNYPFLLSTSTKGDILKIESMIQMRHELQDSFFRAMFIGVNSPYLHCKSNTLIFSGGQKR